MKQKLKIRNIISITVLNLIQIQNLDLSEYLSIDYPNLKEFRLFVYITMYQKESDKRLCFGNFFLWLETKQIEKLLIEISIFELSIETTI